MKLEAPSLAIWQDHPHRHKKRVEGDQPAKRKALSLTVKCFVAPPPKPPVTLFTELLCHLRQHHHSKGGFKNDKYQIHIFFLV